MPVTLTLDSGHRVKAIVDDLSKSGFRLRSRALLHLGQTFDMHLPRDTVACELRWSEGVAAGGIFIGNLNAPAW
jgi:hypothetical protein